MIRFVIYWALGGVLIPVAIMVIDELQGGVFEWPEVVVVLWTSSIMLMALEVVHQPWWWPIVIWGISVGANVVLYSTVGAVLWWLWRLFGRLFK